MAAKDFRVITLQEAFDRFPAIEVIQKMWKPVSIGNLVLGMRNDFLGAEFVQHAMIDTETGELKYMFPVHRESPGVVILPVKRDAYGRIWLKPITEWRPVLINNETGEMGVTVVSLPGGFAKLFADTAKKAKRDENMSYETFVINILYQAATEAGLALDKDSILSIGAYGPNRAYDAFRVHNFIAEVTAEAEAQPEALESIIGKGEWMLLSDYRNAEDGIINNAVAFAREHFRGSDPVSRFETYFNTQPEAALTLLEKL